VTADVIHSFWVPALAGKLDMIPGMVNRLVLEPERVGSFRGRCAEFCGESHALMAFTVRVMEPDAYQAWLRRQRRPAAAPTEEARRRGRSLFLGYGCGACHQVRGTPAQGRVGPDLTHLADRSGLAAETLRNEPASLLAWLRHTPVIKPGVKMPAFGMLPASELADLVSYLEGLE
jgi:cytochrome c oxidase subunit 2